MKRLMSTEWKSRVWRTHFPYALYRFKAADGNVCWIVLNRDYKPIGFDREKFARYEDQPIGVRPQKRHEKRWGKFLETLRKVEQDEAEGHRWFYDDMNHPCAGTAARRRYMALLEEFGDIPVTFVALANPAQEVDWTGGKR